MLLNLNFFVQRSSNKTYFQNFVRETTNSQLRQLNLNNNNIVNCKFYIIFVVLRLAAIDPIFDKHFHIHICMYIQYNKADSFNICIQAHIYILSIYIYNFLWLIQINKATPNQRSNPFKLHLKWEWGRRGNGAKANARDLLRLNSFFFLDTSSSLIVRCSVSPFASGRWCRWCIHQLEIYIQWLRNVHG